MSTEFEPINHPAFAKWTDKANAFFPQPQVAVIREAVAAAPPHIFTPEDDTPGKVISRIVKSLMAVVEELQKELTTERAKSTEWQEQRLPQLKEAWGKEVQAQQLEHVNTQLPNLTATQKELVNQLSQKSLTDPLAGFKHIFFLTDTITELRAELAQAKTTVLQQELKDGSFIMELTAANRAKFGELREELTATGSDDPSIIINNILAKYFAA